MVCSTCKNLLPNEYPEYIDEYVSNHPGAKIDISRIQLSAQKCRYCQILNSVISIADDIRCGGSLNCCSGAPSCFRTDHSFSRTPPIYPNGHNNLERSIGIRMTMMNRHGMHKKMEFYNMADLSEEDKARAPISTLYPNTNSPLTIDWALRKMQECQDTHPNCKTTFKGTTVLPDRVLDLGSATHLVTQKENMASWLQSDVSIYHSSGENVPYCALSHRWGSSQPLQLLRSNLSAFGDKISWLSLPKTYQDAIIYARRLNIRYLWIDSLCIIQDCRKDWEEQSGKMAVIYELATITLSAASAKNGSEGCFFQPPKTATGFVTDGDIVTSLEDTVATAEFLADQNRKVMVLFRELVGHATPSGGYSQDGYSYSREGPLPLMYRGWVYQERILSRRTLYFGRVDVLWQCSDLVSCYCGYWKDRRTENIAPTRVQRNLSHAMQNEWGMKDVSSALDFWWRMALEEYTNLALSHKSDRLPAIAGIAKQISRHMRNPRYLAGLWEEHLLSDLLWHEIQSGNISNSEDYYCPALTTAKERSPSWSWVSAPGRIRYGVSRVYDGDDSAKLDGFRPQILEAKCQSLSSGAQSDEFLDVESGSIKMFGHLTSRRLLAVSIWSNAAYVAPMNSKDREDCLVVKLDSGLGSDPSKWPQPVPYIEFRGYQPTSWKQYPENVWCLRMGRWTYKGVAPSEFEDSLMIPWEYFMLLKCTDETKQEYKRIGIGWYEISKSSTLFENNQERRVITLI